MILALWLGASVLLNCTQSAPGSVEEAEKNIIESFAQIQSLSATITTEESRDDQTGKTTVFIKRQIEWVRSGASFLYRAQVESKKTKKDARGESTQQAATTIVSDGQRVLSISEADGVKSATQRYADVSVMPDPGVMLKALREDSTLTRFPDVKVGTDDCYAIQVVPKEKKGSDLLQTMIYFRKDIGLDVLTVVYGKNTQQMFRSTTSNVRVNPPLPPDRFTLTLPEGVPLTDQTRK